jgi:hypothetical protein
MRASVRGNIWSTDSLEKPSNKLSLVHSLVKGEKVPFLPALHSVTALFIDHIGANRSSLFSQSSPSHAKEREPMRISPPHNPETYFKWG